MTKKTAYILLTAITALIVVGLVIMYFVFLGPVKRVDTGDIVNIGKGTRDPFIPGGDDAVPPTDAQATTTTDLTQAPVPKLRKISAGPVAGGTAFDQTITVKNEAGRKVQKNQTVIRYVETTNGAIFETRADTLNSQKIASISIPKIHEASWSVDGKTAYVRYFSDTTQAIETYAAKLSPTKNNPASSTLPTDIEFLPQDIKGTFLPRNLSQFIPSPFTAGTVFYLKPSGSGAQGIFSRLDDTRRTEVFNSPLSEWLTQWLKTNTIAFTTKASALSDGYLYLLNTDNQRFDRIIGNVAGLTTLVSPNNRYVIYSESDTNSFSTKILNTTDGTVIEFPMKTLPEKCVWSQKKAAIVYCGAPQYTPPSTYPDSWYQGVISFTDTLWIIDVAKNSAYVLVNPSNTAQENLDITNLFTNPKEDYLFFSNKKDGSFWSLELSPNH